MPPPPFEVTWLDSRETVSLSELSRICGMTADELSELVDYGALEPVDSSPQGSTFSAGCIVQLRAVCKLRLDFDLDVFTAAVLMGYLDRINELERQVRTLQATTGDRRSPI
ncbi:MAG: chaperone modulator CbpM [Burkholderiaceae bacterium]